MVRKFLIAYNIKDDGDRERFLNALRQRWNTYEPAEGIVLLRTNETEAWMADKIHNAVSEMHERGQVWFIAEISKRKENTKKWDAQGFLPIGKDIGWKWLKAEESDADGRRKTEHEKAEEWISEGKPCAYRCGLWSKRSPISVDEAKRKMTRNKYTFGMNYNELKWEKENGETILVLNDYSESDLL